MENETKKSRRGLKGPLITFGCISAAFAGVLLLQTQSADKGYFLELVLLFFVFCIDLIYVLYLCALRLGRLVACAITSALIAFFFTPAIGAGEGGAMIAPAWIAFFNSKPDAHVGVFWGDGPVSAMLYAFGVFFCAGCAIIAITATAERFYKGRSR